MLVSPLSLPVDHVITIVDYFDQVSQEGFVNKNILVHFIKDIIMVMSDHTLLSCLFCVVQIPGQLGEDSCFLATNDEATTAALNCLQFVSVHMLAMSLIWKYIIH